ncbi:MAG: histidine--tRNA ligase [Planctomycetes bacterium]|nr:histidine--tRNA ligase [Planctomycetota bacterium]MCB9889836.1 histidine--tRNA ligase [Planctomycetota bacterium]
MLPREALIDTAKRVYRSFGFSPIDTPALEYAEVLLGKGGDESDRQVYRFEHGKHDVAMRFDLTVPLARFVAQHEQELGLPFKRYHIGAVWRGENTQRGRYREFMQCDFDTLGTESMIADVETGLVIHELLRAIGFQEFTIRLNNRKVLNGLLESVDLADRAVPVLRALDKLAKVGADAVCEEMARTAGASDAQARQVLALAGLGGSDAELLARVESLVAGSELGRLGVAQLREVLEGIAAGGVSTERIKLDLSIARGLDYYTGTIFETFLGALPDIGSVCSGGRYDDLASKFTRSHIPGIGASLGLDRLLAAMEELAMLESAAAPAPVFLAYFSADRAADYCRLAMDLRRAGIGVELYPSPRKLGEQLKYASRRGFEFAVIVGDEEWATGVCQLKRLATKESESVQLDDLAARLRGGTGE